MSDGVRRDGPLPKPTGKRATPVRGDAVPELKVDVAPQVLADLQLLKHTTRDLFSAHQLRQPGELASRLPPSLQALLAPSAPLQKGALRTPTDPSHVEATVESVARILQDGAVAESEMAAVGRTVRRIDDVLALASQVALLPPQVRERVQALLLGPLQRLKAALNDSAGALWHGVAARDADALRAALEQPRPRIAQLDVDTAAFHEAPPSFARLERFERGDLVLVPRSSGPPSLGVVVGKDPDGLRVEVDGAAGFGVKTLSAAQVASANPFRIGDIFKADGKDMHVIGAGGDGTLRIIPFDPAHPDHAVISRGGDSAARLAGDLVVQRQQRATDAMVPVPSVSTDPAHYARTGNSVVGAYLQNGIAASALFAERFAAMAAQRTPIDGATLAALCRVMHHVACLGREGDRPYSTARYSTETVHPGEVRTGGNPHVSRSRAARYADAVVQQLGLAPLQDGPVLVRGLPGDAEPPYSFVNGLHFYPQGDALPAYFECAAQILDGLKKRPAVPAGGKTPEAAVDAIADLYHVLVNARPFDQVNNSMFMGQVNVLLQRFGHAPVAHGFIDHLAHRMSSDSFRAVFRAHLAGTLPTPAELGIEAF